MYISCSLSTLMGKARLSIQDVHVKTGLSRTTLTNLYHDRVCRVDYDTLIKLCQLFNCGIDDILVLNKEEKDSKK